MFFFVWLVGLFSCLSLPFVTFCSFNSLFFFSSPYRSFVGVIVRPSIKSFLCTLLRLIDRSFVRSFVCPPVRLCLRSIVRTIICSLVRSFIHPFDQAFVCRYFLFFCLARCFVFLFVPPFRHLLFFQFVVFFSSPYRSFVGVIVRPSIKSFLCTLLRLIDRSLV